MQMNDDRIYLTKTALARATGLDPRSKELQEIEPTAYLAQTKGRRIDLFAAALADVVKAKQADAKRN